jgi:hypothetical protein
MLLPRSSQQNTAGRRAPKWVQAVAGRGAERHRHVDDRLANHDLCPRPAGPTPGKPDSGTAWASSHSPRRVILIWDDARGWACGNEAADGRVLTLAAASYPVAVHAASAA